MANNAAAPGTGWQETYMGGSEEAEKALFRRTLPGIETIQETVARRQNAADRRAFHNKGTAIEVALEIADDLPEHLRVGILRPGAVYRGFGRFSRSQSFRGRDGELDQRGFAFRVETPDGPQDFLFSNTPISFAPDPVMFLRVARIAARSHRLLVPPRLILALGLREGIRVLRNILSAPDRSIAFTAQQYWTRTPFQLGSAAGRLFVRPATPGRRVASTDEADYLTVDLAQELRAGSRSFGLYTQLFVDEARTPIEDASHPWLESDAPPVRLGTVVIPQQDLGGAEAKALAERVEASVSFNPWNTPGLRPLGRSNRARLEAYNRSAAGRGAPVRPRPAEAMAR
jgi:hypothetical protein